MAKSQFHGGHHAQRQCFRDIFQKLARRAADLNVTVEELVSPALEQVASAEPTNGHLPASSGIPDDEWKARFHEFLTTAHTRAGRYPPGFEADVSRESMYEDSGG